MIQNLKKLIVKLSMTGTLEIVEQPFQLYKDSYGFVVIRCIVPVTPNTTQLTVCTVHSIATDERGTTHEGEEKYPLNYAGRAEIGGYECKVYEAPMPYEFTSTVGNLDIIFNYSDADDDGNAIDLLTSGTYSTTVLRGGASKGSVPLSEPDVILAKVNATLEKVEQFERDASEAFEKIDNLTQPPEYLEDGGAPGVKIGEKGNFVFKNIEGDAGKSAYEVWLSQGNTGTVEDYLASIKGETGADGKDGELIVPHFYIDFATGRLIQDVEVSNLTFTINNKGHLEVN